MQRWAWLILPILLIACEPEYVPVKEVRSCSKVTLIELVKRPLLDHYDIVYVRLTLADSRDLYKDVWQYKEWGVSKDFLASISEIELGKEYCRTTYERIK